MTTQIMEPMTVEELYARFPGLERALRDHDGEDGTTFELEEVGLVEVYEEEDDEGARTLLTRFRLTEVLDGLGQPVVFESWPEEEILLEGRMAGVNAHLWHKRAGRLR